MVFMSLTFGLLFGGRVTPTFPFHNTQSTFSKNLSYSAKIMEMGANGGQIEPKTKKGLEALYPQTLAGIGSGGQI